VAGAEGLIYLFSEAGVGLVVDVSGDEGEIVSEIELGETILSTASLDNGAVYIRSDRHLWRFGK
jgi:hypothetical protein